MRGISLAPKSLFFNPDLIHTLIGKAEIPVVCDFTNYAQVILIDELSSPLETATRVQLDACLPLAIAKKHGGEARLHHELGRSK